MIKFQIAFGCRIVIGYDKIGSRMRGIVITYFLLGKTLNIMSDITIQINKNYKSKSYLISLKEKELEIKNIGRELWVAEQSQLLLS